MAEEELPLPKGSYNIDFEALDDSFNPFAGNTKKIRSSPPLEAQIAKSTPTVQESPHQKDVAECQVNDCNGSNVDAVAEKATPPLAENKNEAAAASDSSPPVAVEKKPVRKKGTKVVKKPKSRPVSKNLEGQEGGDIEIHIAGQPSASEPPQAAESASPAPPPPPPADGETSCPPTSTTPPKEIQGDGDAAAATTSAPEKSPQPAEGVDNAEIARRRERSGSRAKKSKHKSRRKSGSHSEVTDGLEGVRRDSEGRDSGGESIGNGREFRGSPRSSVSTVSGESQCGHDSTAALAGEAGKSKHPAARALEQQVRGEQAPYHAESAHSDSLGKGESEMADSHHANESVVKLVQVLKYSQSDWNKMKQELELGFQAQLLAKEREWGCKLADRDSRLATLEDANKKLRQTHEDMRVVVAEYEKTISQLQSEKEKSGNASQQSLQDALKERDQALEDLQSVETAFSDLHRRYEKTKAVVEGFKQNEEALKKCVAEQQSKLKKAEQKVQVVKGQAEEKLERATEEVEKIQKSSTSEIARLEAALRKAELQVQSQEALLEQKVKENTELAAICDELIAKVQ